MKFVIYFYAAEDLVYVTICKHTKVIIRCVIGGRIRVVAASYDRHVRAT